MITVDVTLYDSSTHYVATFRPDGRKLGVVVVQIRIGDAVYSHEEWLDPEELIDFVEDDDLEFLEAVIDDAWDNIGDQLLPKVEDITITRVDDASPF